MMTMVMMICCYPILWLMIAIFAWAAKRRGSIVLGMKLPEDCADDMEVNALARRCRKVLWLSGIPLTLVLLPIFWIPYESVSFTVWMTWIPLMILFPFLVLGYYHRRLKKLTAAKGWKLGEEERHWWLGLFYYDPQYPRTTVKKRIGTGSTMNIARPGCKIVLAFVFLCLLSMPLLGIWMMAEDFSPRVLTVTEDSITAEHLGSDTVAYDDISDIALLREMPRHHRSSGYEMTYIDKGIFNVDGYGRCRICIDRRDPFFLVMMTADETYIFSVATQKDVETVIDHVEPK